MFIKPMFNHGKRGQVAAPIFNESRTKFFSLTIFKHDFGPYPSDRELFYEILSIVVMLLGSPSVFLCLSVSAPD